MVVHSMRDKERISVVDFAAPLSTEKGLWSLMNRRAAEDARNEPAQTIGKRWWKNPANCDLISAFFSFLCLFLMFLWRYALDGNDVIVRVSRETLLFTRDDTVVENMRLLHATWNAHCDGKYKLLLQQPTWPADPIEKEKGRVMHSSIYAFDIPIFWLAVFVFLFSITFQMWRYLCSDSEFGSRFFRCLKSGKILYNAEAGPDFSRWLEYFFTSPLQILIVSSSFGFATVDALLGQCGMQAALVLLGYDIEQQIKKIYKRKKYGTKGAKRFYHALQPLIADLRIFVYLGFSWLLHFAIWGIPFPGHGIGGKYAQLQDQLEQCIDTKIPDAVTAIYWLQFILFTLFGVVCTGQVIRALLHGAQKNDADKSEKPDSEQTLLVSEQKNTEDDKKLYEAACADEWRKAAWWYSFLSITAKTCLEAGLAAYVAMYEEWLEIPEAQWQKLSNSTCAQQLNNRTCYALTA